MGGGRAAGGLAARGRRLGHRCRTPLPGRGRKRPRHPERRAQPRRLDQRELHHPRHRAAGRRGAGGGRPGAEAPRGPSAPLRRRGVARRAAPTPAALKAPARRPGASRFRRRPGDDSPGGGSRRGLWPGALLRPDAAGRGQLPQLGRLGARARPVAQPRLAARCVAGVARDRGPDAGSLPTLRRARERRGSRGGLCRRRGDVARRVRHATRLVRGRCGPIVAGSATALSAAACLRAAAARGPLWRGARAAAGDAAGPSARQPLGPGLEHQCRRGRAGGARARRGRARSDGGAQAASGLRGRDAADGGALLHVARVRLAAGNVLGALALRAAARPRRRVPRERVVHRRPHGPPGQDVHRADGRRLPDDPPRARARLLLSVLQEPAVPLPGRRERRLPRGDRRRHRALGYAPLPADDRPIRQRTARHRRHARAVASGARPCRVPAVRHHDRQVALGGVRGQGCPGPVHQALVGAARLLRGRDAPGGPGPDRLRPRGQVPRCGERAVHAVLPRAGARVSVLPRAVPGGRVERPPVPVLLLWKQGGWAAARRDARARRQPPVARGTRHPHRAARDGCHGAARLLPTAHGLARAPEPWGSRGVVMARPAATVAELFETMAYGPAPESDKPALEWLARHGGEFGLFLAGRWTKGKTDEGFDVINPATTARLARVTQAGSADVAAAVAAARQAFPAWSALSGHARARHLYALARAVQKHTRLLAVLESLDNGKSIRETRDLDIPLVARHFYHHAGWAQLLEREFAGYGPLGVVGQIVPWNFPLLMVAWKVAPALAAGNTVVLKPAEFTPLTALCLAELAHEAGLPAGVLNVITGDGTTGKLLVDHPDVDKIAFTGSTEVGRIIRQATAGSGKRLSLELGGKSPFVVFEDADLDSVVEGVVDAIWFNQGQVCCAGSRLLVQEGVAQRLIAKLRARVDKGVEEGAEMWQPSWACPTEGYFYPPTLFTDVSPAATIAQVEIFGPVLVSMTFRTPKEAVELANNTPYGLAASVWTENINLALDVAPKLKAGVVWINSTNLFDAAAGFGGYRESGFGREGGREGMYEYLKSGWEEGRGKGEGYTTLAPASEQGITLPPSPLPPPRLSPLDRKYKPFIGGKQVRPDQGYSRKIAGPDGRVLGEVGEGNRKDIRNAVEAAHAAEGWGRGSGHTRAQILYFIAENLATRAQEFAEDRK